MSKVIYVDDKDFQLWCEEIFECFFVHVNIKKMTKASFKRLEEAWHRLLIDAYFDGWEDVFTYTKDPRIVYMIGGATEVGQDNPDLVNFGYRMFKWDLK